MPDWKQKVVLVTGASQGLGKVIAQSFADRGANVGLAARDADRLQQAADEMPTANGKAIAIPADVTQDSDVDRMIEQCIDEFGKLDVLVNNVGVSARGTAIDATPADYQQLFELNFLTAVRCTRAAMPHLRKSKGRLVNIGSLASKTASPFMGAYPVSKFALAAYSQQLRIEPGNEDVHILLACPGPIQRDDAGERYTAQTDGLPDSATKPGGGAKLKNLAPKQVAQAIIRACEKRQPELILPSKAKWLFAISALSAKWGDWILRKNT